MKKGSVLAHFDNDTYAVADALGITRQAVEQWGEVIPEGAAYKLQVITAGHLRVDPACYAKAKTG
jgi:hypothetical protein